MSILKTQTKLQQLQKRSADALGIFQNTVNNLADTNANIRTELKTREDEIKKLQEERAELKGLETQNQTVMDKIQDFLGSLNS